MEFNVSVGEGVSGESGSVMTEPASNPAGLQAREEYARIMGDPTHEKHAGYLRRDPQVEAYIDGLYKKAYPGTAPAEIEGRESLTAGGPDDAAPVDPAVVQAIVALQHEQGETYPAFVADVQFGFTRLAQKLGGEVDDLTAAALAAGMDYKTMTTFLHHFGKQARTYAP